MSALVTHPLFWLVWLALSLAVCVPISVLGIRWYWAWQDRRREVHWGITTETLPLEVYRPEDAEFIIGVDPAGVQQTIVIAEKLPDGSLHVVMAHDWTEDD